MGTSLTVYLMRHGEAAWTAPDRERRLTERGVEQSQAVLAQLSAGRTAVSCILCSPYQRARQTAAEAERVTDLKASQHACLTPDEPVAQTLEALAPYVQDQTLIVAHQPLLGNLVSLLTAGNLDNGYPFGTSEVVVLELEAWAPGCGRILRNFHP